MTDSRIEQLATEAATTPGAPDYVVRQAGVESLAKSANMPRQLSQHGIESLAKSANMPRQLSQHGIEAATVPIPGSSIGQLATEIITAPGLSPGVSSVLLEVIWREPPTPGMFAFPHDWTGAWRDQWQWRTDVIESHDGGESRIRLRTRPLRRIGMSVLAGGAVSVNLDAWLHAHHGRTVYLPMWLTMRRVSADASAGGLSLSLAGLDLRYQRTMQSRSSGVTGSGPMLILEADGDAQLVWVTACDIQAGTVTLRDPLARAVQAGARCAPLVEARLVDEVRVIRHAASVSTIDLEFEADPPLYVHAAPTLPELNLSMGWPVFTHLPVLDLRNWATEHDIRHMARIDAIDNGIAQAWVSRRNKRPTRVMSWSLLAQGAAQIEAAYGLLEYLAGRWQECWVADELAGIDLVESAVAGQAALIVNRATYPSYLEEGGRGLLLYVPGQAPAALRMSGLASDDHDRATLQLATPLPFDAPAGSKLVGLRYARLDHDAVDCIWHTDDVLELALRFVDLLPRGTRMSGYQLPD